MKALVLCSGGIKSAFLALEAAKESEVQLLFLAYGQFSEEREALAVTRIAQRCRAKLAIIKVPTFPPHTAPLLRFLYFFGHALPIARKYGCRKLYYGISKEDITFVTDPKLTEEFVTGLQHLLDISIAAYTVQGKWLGGVELDTPLRKLQLEHIVRLGNEWKINWQNTWSCNSGERIHCGTCIYCLRRKRAFVREGSEDPTTYTV